MCTKVCEVEYVVQRRRSISRGSPRLRARIQKSRDFDTAECNVLQYNIVSAK